MPVGQRLAIGLQRRIARGTVGREQRLQRRDAGAVGVAVGLAFGEAVGETDGLGLPVGEPDGEGVGVTVPNVPARTVVAPLLT